MDISIARALFRSLHQTLHESYERGGCVEINLDYTTHHQIIEFPSAHDRGEEERYTYYWPGAFPYIWHTHPGERGNRYEAPSATDILTAATMSVNMNYPVTGFIVEEKGVWVYTVKATRNMMENEELVESIFFSINNWAARLGGVKEILADYEDENLRVPILDVGEYLDKWKKYAEEMQNSVKVKFFSADELSSA